jgi:hypothetical protein
MSEFRTKETPRQRNAETEGIEEAAQVKIRSVRS